MENDLCLLFWNTTHVPFIFILPGLVFMMVMVPKYILNSVQKLMLRVTELEAVQRRQTGNADWIEKGESSELI